MPTTFGREVQIFNKQKPTGRSNFFFTEMNAGPCYKNHHKLSMLITKKSNIAVDGDKQQFK